MKVIVAYDIVRNKRMVEWTNKSGQRILSSRLAREDLCDVQRKIDRLEKRGLTKDERIQTLCGHFNRFADKVTVLHDIPGGTGGFRFSCQGKPVI